MKMIRALLYAIVFLLGLVAFSVTVNHYAEVGYTTITSHMRNHK